MSTVDIRWGQLFSQKSHRGVPIITVDTFTLNMSTVDIRQYIGMWIPIFL